MSKFIRNPEVVEAVKWDGSTEGAAEVRALLDKAGTYLVGGFIMEFDANGVPQRDRCYVKFIRGNRYPRHDDEWMRLKLGQWLVYRPQNHPETKIKVELEHTFEESYTEVSLIDQDVLTNWVAEGMSA